MLLVPEDRQVSGQQDGDQPRDEHDVHHEEARRDRLRRELAAEREKRQPRPEERHRQQHGVGDAQAGARQQVVGEGVAGEAVADGQQQQRHADDPVDLARPAEGAGEEHAADVHDDGGHEQQGSPVVDLADDEPGAHVEAQAQHRGVGLGDLCPPERGVGAGTTSLGPSAIAARVRSATHGTSYWRHAP